MSSFEKLRCAFDENFVRCAHYRVCNANSPAAVELFARNGTQPEPRLRINGVHFKTLHSIGAGKSWKISSLPAWQIEGGGNKKDAHLEHPFDG